MWLVFLFFHLIGLVGYNLVLRKSILNKIDRFTLATIMSTGIALPLLVVLFFHPFQLEAYNLKSLFTVLITSGLVISLHLTNVKALQYLEASVYSVLYNLRIILATILGIVFLAEKIIPLQITGGILIFLAILVVRQKGNKSLTTRGIIWGIAVAFVLSFLNLFEKILIADVGYLNYAIPVMLLSAVIMWVILLFRKNKISFKTFANREMISLMSLRALSAYGFSLALSVGNLSITNYISSLSVVIIVVLGVVILKERDYLFRKILAVGIAAIGLTIILISNL